MLLFSAIIDENGDQKMLAKTILATKNSKRTSIGFTTNGKQDLFIKSPSNCIITYDFKEPESKK